MRSATLLCHAKRCLPVLLILAAAAWAADTNVVEEAAAQTSLIDYFNKGGIFMYPILLCSVLTVYLIIDVVLLTRKAKMVPPQSVEKLKELMAAKNIEGALAACDEYPSIMTRILAAGLRAMPRGKTALEETLAEYDVREASGIRVRVAYLNTVATVAPMLGLLGTVSGMIKAFANVGALGMGKASLLADNIAEALITTYAGLVIAIPAMVAFFFFRNRVNDMMVVVEDTIGDLVLTLEK
ncbi:MotA/TolQ/ExbB proton channel family protein [bacterium]|nr:MotA/TolQ/ExbB proton channel family protein [bacterium]